MKQLKVKCAICGKPCRLMKAKPHEDPPWMFGGWYCRSCEAFTETDVEIED